MIIGNRVMVWFDWSDWALGSTFGVHRGRFAYNVYIGPLTVAWLLK